MTGYQSQAAFSSSKGAVIPLAKSLAVSWLLIYLLIIYN